MIPESKSCCTCLIDKPLSDFYKGKLGKYGRHSSCKVCMLSYQKRYHDGIKPIRKEKAAKYYKENKESVDIRNKNWIKNNKEKVIKATKAWGEKNKEINAIKAKVYYKKNKRRLLDRGNEWKSNRLNSDPLYKMLCYSRNRIKQAFKSKGLKKSKKTKELLGVDILIAKQHLEKQFKKGMSWGNQGLWHIDHKIPLSSAKTEEELVLLCHYTNLQPLWAKDNLEKSDKILPVQIMLTI